MKTKAIVILLPTVTKLEEVLDVVGGFLLVICVGGGGGGVVQYHIFWKGNAPKACIYRSWLRLIEGGMHKQNLTADDYDRN